MEEENTINPWGSHHPPDASTIAAMAAGNPQIQQIYKSFLDEMEKHTKPATIYASVNEEFMYNKENDTIYTTVDALGQHFNPNNVRNTAIELFNPETGNIRKFTWRFTHDTGPKSTMHHDYRGMHEGRELTLCVWFHSGKNVSA